MPGGSADGGERLLELSGLSVGADGRVLMEGLGLCVREGEFVALLGPSGCGKTTLLRAVKYQIVIMFMIAAGTAMGSMLIAILSYRALYNSRHQLVSDRIRSGKG